MTVRDLPKSLQNLVTTISPKLPLDTPLRDLSDYIDTIPPKHPRTSHDAAVWARGFDAGIVEAIKTLNRPRKRGKEKTNETN